MQRYKKMFGSEPGIEHMPSTTRMGFKLHTTKYTTVQQHFNVYYMPQV